MHARIRVVLEAAVVSAVASLLVPASAHAAGSVGTPRWSYESQFNTGLRAHVSTTGGTLKLDGALPTAHWDDPYTSGGAVAYEYGSWTSPWVNPGFGIKTLVPSWTVTTPNGTWVRVLVRARRGSTTGSWDAVANWASGTSSIHRSSETSQTDDISSVDIDTVRSRGGAFTGWQVRVILFRQSGSTATPAVGSIGAVAAAYSTRTLPSTSTTTMTATKILPVPAYSQMIHRGEFTTYGGGGPWWCSPTTTSMLLRYWKSGPSASAYAFADDYDDPWVDHAAAYSYDYRYRGTGNWPFTMGYAGLYKDAYVTRVSSLRDAEYLIKAGIPVGASIAFDSGELTGAPLSSTSGHILAVVGFTSAGNVVVNDPAAPSDSTVRRTYKRGQFERAWLGGSGGIAYVIRP
jgi:hypothetical protein